MSDDCVTFCCSLRPCGCHCNPNQFPWWARVLLRIGLLRGFDGKLRGPVSFNPWHMWTYMVRRHDFCGIFRNRPNVIRRVRGSLLPRRWGFYLLGFEFGHRG